MQHLFATPIMRTGDVLTGPWRAPRQMLHDQTYEGHASIHDDATAAKLGFRGGTIEGPTHFSQVVPLACELWGERFLAQGCISAHYRNAVYEGEEVRVVLDASPAGDRAGLRMEKRDGTEILVGTVGVGRDQPPSALEQRMAGLRAPTDLVILRDLRVGMKIGRIPVTMKPDQHMGDLYPFTLRQKLENITEPSPRYAEIIPIEMISVLIGHVSRVQGFPVRGPSVGLFADQEIRLHGEPLLVGEPYEIEREIVALSASRRTGSSWIRTHVFRPGEHTVLATMLLNSAVLKDSYAPYEQELADLKETAAHG